MKFISHIIALIILSKFVLSKNIYNSKRIETASHGIAQVIDEFSEKFSVHFKLVIIDNHSALYEIAGKVLKISKSTLIVKQSIHEDIIRPHGLSDDTFSYVYLFNDGLLKKTSPKIL